MIRSPRRGLSLLGAALALLLISGASRAAQAGDGKDALRLVPAATDAIVAVNVDRLRGSPYYDTVVGWLRQQADMGEGAKVLEDRIGFDLDKDLSTLVFSGEVEGGSEDDFVLFLEGRYDRARLMKVAGEGGSSGAHRKVRYVATDQGVALAIVGGFVVVAPTVDRIKSVIDVYRRKARPLRRNRKISALLRGTDTSRDVWMVLEVGPEVKKGMKGAPMMDDVEAMSASVDLKSGFGLKMRLLTDSNASASTLGASLSQVARLGAGDPNLGQILGKLGVSTRKRAVDVTLDLTQAELASLMGSVGL